MGNVIYASIIAAFLESKIFGEDIKITHVSSLHSVTSNSLVFSKNEKLQIIDNVKSVVICPLSTTISHTNNITYIPVLNPRLSFAKVVNKYFSGKKFSGVHPTTIFGENTSIHATASIGPFCVIGDNVSIGEETIINNNIVISDNSVIGARCYIKSGTVIGEDGFGFDFEDDKTPVRLPHKGKVIIGNDVEIGSKCTVARGTIEDTVIENHVKIDDQVHIAHNCHVGEKTIITACAELSGSVVVGRGCWLGPNCSILQKIIIGDGSTIGIGAVVTSNVESSKKIMGLEGLALKNLARFKKRVDYGS